ncbi:MAG: hypothetical protein WA997_14065 [Anaerolineales bacterium]|nr:hypothetical protein [Anaerolineales bacterium]
MTTEAWLLVFLLGAMFALLIWGKFPTWVIFIGTLTITMTLRLAPLDGLLSGFSNPGVITVAALFPIAAGMYATGAITIASNLLIGLPKNLHGAQI